ncbi:Blp family class II bacteriocin [Paenibacillus woosongensis]|uniref:Blp family class II bacteriocin n=2 Tax=Paenibacillus woosongensis TaxID=307580 RepID=A0AA95I446_9BACL|nr:Blp family class II bacteriocin [Paenibacillus woosongensis]WHX48496.1 Blp family class II bacteriocin [Paenibacillus woosongensis]GIP60401.1 hypothetical protein J15TS10_42150 [Paenibacillus woosongensis]
MDSVMQLNGFSELSLHEMMAIDGGGDFSWSDLGKSVVGGAASGAIGGAASGALAGGVGAGPGALVGGAAGAVGGAAAYLLTFWW